MAQFTVELSNEVVLRVNAAFCAVYNYSGPDTDADRSAFVQAKVIAYLQEVVGSYEASQAAEAARQQALADAASEIVITPVAPE